jgi:hypothetical protein
MTLPAANTGSNVNRSMFYIEGGSGMNVDSKAIKSQVVLMIKSNDDIELSMDESATGPREFLLLQGKPIGEPVKQHGPFVMNTDAEIQQAFMDYQRTQFGGWPWPRDDMVFPREKGRFANLNGKETAPPDGACIAD